MTFKALAAAAASLDNADGGTPLLGVRDRIAGHDAVVGTEHTPDWCRQPVHELTTPSLPVNGSRDVGSFVGTCRAASCRPVDN